MQGSPQIRHCGVCRSNVYNLSEMTEEQAESLLARNDELCVRYYRRNDGTIVTSDCRPVQTASRLVVLAAATAFAGATVATAASALLVPAPVSSEYEVAMGMKLNFRPRQPVVIPESAKERRAVKKRLRRELRAKGLHGDTLRDTVENNYQADLRERRRSEAALELKKIEEYFSEKHAEAMRAKSDPAANQPSKSISSP